MPCRYSLSQMQMGIVAVPSPCAVTKRRKAIVCTGLGPSKSSDRVFTPIINYRRLVSGRRPTWLHSIITARLEWNLI
jgi:hypothetical protein